MLEDNEKIPGSSPSDTDLEDFKKPQLPILDAMPASEWNREACLCLLGCTSLLFCTVGLVNAFGVFQQYYVHDFLSDHTPSQISWLGSFAIFTMFSGTLPVGYLNDKYGPVILLRVGSVTFLFAFFMTSICTQYYQLFLAQGLLLGIGLSVSLSPAFSAVPRHFAKHRGIAMGICVAGSSLGGVIWPIVFSRLFLQVGFPWGVRIGAFIMLPLMALACLTIKWPKAQANMPKAEPDFRILMNPVLITFAFAEFFVFLGLFTPFFYISSYSVHIGLNSSLAFYMVSIINASSLFGRLFTGMAADRIGLFNVLMLCVLLSGAICMCLTTAISLGGVVILSLAYGFTSGAVISLQTACAASLVKPHQMGLAIGAVMAVLSIAGLIGTPIVGQLLLKYDYLGAALFSGLVMFVGFLLLLVARFKKDPRLFAKA